MPSGPARVRGDFHPRRAACQAGSMTDAAPSSPGWYEDPDVPDQLRYFDGILWTSHVTPLRTRRATATTTTGTATPTPSPAPGSNTAPTAAAGPAGSDAASSPYGSPPAAHPYDGPPASSSQGAPPIPNPYAAPPAWTMRQGPTAADGTPLASLGLRVVAYILDSIVINVLALIAGGWFAFRAIEQALPAMTRALEENDADAFNAALGLVDVTYITLYTAVKLLIALAYGILSLTRWSASPSMLLVGISVRRTGSAGVIGWDAASRRVGFTVVLDALTNLPTLGLAALVVKVYNLLRPFRDSKRQALHDRFADTLVVTGRQPPRAPQR